MAASLTSLQLNSLKTRSLTAAIVLIFVSVSYYFLNLMGLKLIVLACVIIGSLELNNVLFKNSDLRTSRILFFIFNLLIFLLSSWRPIYAGLFYSFFFVSFCVCSISLNRKLDNLNHLAVYQAKAAMGFFYIGLLPSFAEYLIDMPLGLYWFVSLLCVVFAGDIGAYFVGMLFGEKKIMPNISPKKTLAGAWGGLIFSFAAGLLCSFWFPHIGPIKFGLLSVSTGVIAQFGDYFESLLKRVANVKDSGGLMPGHGGVLDRIDGVLFASPIFLLGAIILENLI